ncbi:hypothetical protein FHS39_003019 [Streptomyces olivoverticillatus]|uniref:DUF4232 domain-containing protein n=1 Tax=Streptomyces olivoverticillatus TaxID=66427 RepID=A0A7W7LPD7_9ACTN|nr:DUF4232 domain-containing protein [Streptomyces olivoverticillatus]MBB4893985.1 hypothetical protein [Streptomyces olivoverticillatus]
MTIRTLRITAAAFTAAAALTLTACGSSSDSKKDDKAAAADPQASDATSDQGSDAGADGDEGGSDTEGSSAKAGACTPAAVKFEARAVKSPVNHVLLVATNTSKSPCTAYGFPFLRFDEDQASSGVTEESKPQGKITLAPGKSAYAGVLASAADGSGGKGHEAKKLAVTWQNPDGNPIEGGPSQADVPGGSLHVDDSAKTTYWLDSEAAALKW